MLQSILPILVIILKLNFHYSQRSHGADQHILIYCVEGKGELKINKKKYVKQRYNFFIIPMNVAYNYKADEDKPWTIYRMHFKGNNSVQLQTCLLNRVEVT